MLTSDHTRYRVKYLKRFKGAPPKIVVQRTITCLEYTGHPLTEIYFKTLDVIDLTRVFRGHKLTVNNITLQEATEEFRKLFNYFLCSYGIKFNEVEIRLHNHPRKSPYLAVRPTKGRMALIGCVRIPIVQSEPVRPIVTVNKIGALAGHVINNVLVITDDKSLHCVSDVTSEQLRNGIALLFYRGDGNVVEFCHQQDCCEEVYLEDIDGDINDIIGEKILSAGERTEERTDDYGYYSERTQWTFYHIRTAKGCVVIRWYGSSNGYYSESVDIDVVPLKDSLLRKPERLEERYGRY